MSNQRLDQNQNDRRLAGLVNMGKVVETRLSPIPAARVQVGNLTSGWLLMGFQKLGANAQAVFPYEVGELVGFATLSGDMKTGFIMCAIPTGALTGDPAANVLKAIAPGGFELTGDVTITGDVSVKGGVTSTGDQVAGGISQINHKHPGDSGGITGAPL